MRAQSSGPSSEPRRTSRCSRRRGQTVFAGFHGPAAPAAAELYRSAGNRGETNMRRLASAILLLIPTLSLVVAEGNGQDQPPTPAEQYAALKKEYDKTPGTSVPSTDEERLRFVGHAYKHHYAVALKFLEL